MQPAVQAFHAAAAALEAERAELADRTEGRAVELALELASKLVAGAIEAQPERVLDVVRGALRCLIERERIQVLVHPEDLDLVRGAIHEVVAELGGIEHVEVQEERRIGRGGALVRTATAQIDASIQTKLDRAREIIAAELEAA
jgi:flagellar assembly protein FliH